MNLSKGCGDNSCIHGRPGGMGTNGGCSCKKAPPKTVLVALRALRHDAEAHGPVSLSADNILDLLTEIEGRDKEIARLQEALRQREDQLRNALDIDRAAHEPALGHFKVLGICDAYESGYGQGLKAEGAPNTTNPYKQGSPEYEAYAIGDGKGREAERPAPPPGVKGEDNANTAADRPSAITAGEAAASDGDSACPVLSPNSVERARTALRAIYDATAEDGLHENKALFNVAREGLGYSTATKGEAP
jgi:hypothetical protein